MWRRVAELRVQYVEFAGLDEDDDTETLVSEGGSGDALGLHLDSFQRITVDPSSISVISYTPTRPFVVRVNDTGGDLASLVPKPDPEPGAEGAEGTADASADAVVGGSTGVN